jgi:hypothetical protein
MFLVGGTIILFSVAVPPRLGLSLEFAVGIVLTVVGVLNVASPRGQAYGGTEGGRSPSLPAFLVGLVHGLAGSAAIALLVLATVRDPVAGLIYLVVFGLGTILGMMLVTLSFAMPVAFFAGRVEWSGARLRLATGVVSMALGVYVMIHIGWVDGLFGPTPHWTPR